MTHTELTELESLRAENARLREALEKIVATKGMSASTEKSAIAIRALKVQS